MNKSSRDVFYKTIQLASVFILLAASLNSFAKLNIPSVNGETKYPSVDEAFTLNAYNDDKNSAVVTFSAIKGTYVYENSFKFKSNNPDVTLSHVHFPKGEIITDEHYGKTKVFKDDFEISMTLNSSSSSKQDFELSIEYQGCLKDVLCYPPKEDTFLLTALTSKETIKNQKSGSTVITAAPEQIKQQLEPRPIQAIQDQNQAVELLTNAKFFTVIGGFFIFGLLLSLTPCVLPMLPILSGIIAGHKHNITKTHAFMLSFVYVLSMALTYSIAGVLIASAGVNLTSSLQHPVVIILISTLFIFLAIASFGYFELKLPDMITQRLANAQQHQKGGTYIGVAIMGLLSALVISPCATAPLSGALLYISSTGNAWLGGLALFSMGFAMGVPLMLFGTSAGHFLPKAGPWMKEINTFFGVVFIGLAIFLLSRIINSPIVLVLWALLFLFYAVHLGLLEPAEHGWQRIQKGFALVIAIYGGFLLAGATQHQTDILHPFGIKNGLLTNANPSALQGQPINNPPVEFTKIKTISELEDNLTEAKQQDQLTILDFYADWCVSCRSMEKNIFTDPKVASVLRKFKRLKIDLTNNTTEDKLIMKQLSVFNPPTFIFYNKDGNEIKNTRIIGEVDTESFYEVISNL